VEENKKYPIITEEVIKKVKGEKPDDAEYENFKYYSDQVYPAKLIDENRPNEHDIVKNYRKLTYQPVFAEVFDRVLNSLSKIHRSDGYFMKFPDDSQFTKIAETERLKPYLETKFTASRSLQAWAFQVALKQYVIDANAVCVVWADEVEDPTDFREVKPYIINSNRIVYHYEGNSIVYMDERSVEKKRGMRDVFYSIDKQRWCKWSVDSKGTIYLDEEKLFNLPEVPFFTLGGIVEEEYPTGREYESRFKAMLPWLNVATIEFSDLRAEITMHQNSTMWIYQDEQCPDCIGQGYLVKEGNKVPCTNVKCKNGQIPSSPFDVVRIRPAKTNMGESAPPTPPIGYVQKQTEIAVLQSQRIDAHRYRSLAAVNMQFLEQVPADTSGISKAYDRDETNNTFFGVAVDLARIQENIARLTAYWRYLDLYTAEQIKEMLPIYIIPNQFDVLGTGFVIEELKAAKDSGVNDSILAQMEMEIIKKRFPNDTRLQNILTDAYNLDPMSGMTEDDKALRISNKGATKQDYIISSYIQDFIKRAYEENKDFQSFGRKEKIAVLMKYADEKLAEIKTKIDPTNIVLPDPIE